MHPHSLSNEEIARYARQLIIPELGVQGQSRILKSSAIVVGVGGLGSSLLMYLAAAGMGTLGLVDYDQVEESNLSRQIIHDESKIGMSKVQSAVECLIKLNSKCILRPFQVLLNSENALEILGQFDVIVDATDNVATRYLLNDSAVLLKKPLVSGSALKLEGQLTVYNYNGSPCYRCLFPVPPPANTVTNCSDGGVLGVVPGLIGSLQALEVLKLVSGMGPAYAQKMLLMDALSGSFRVVKLRPRKPDCIVCGTDPTLTRLIDYVQFCGSDPMDKTIPEKVLLPHERISALEYSQITHAHLLLDVRTRVQFDICALPGSVNIPWQDLENECHREPIQKARQSQIPIYVVCRLGNDSQLAVRHLKNQGYDQVMDIVGGLDAWALTVDKHFPRY